MGDVVESPLYIILGSGSLEELLSPQHSWFKFVVNLYTSFDGKSHFLGLLAHMNVSASSLKSM